MPNYRRKPCRFTSKLNKDGYAKRVHHHFTLAFTFTFTFIFIFTVQHTECV